MSGPEGLQDYGLTFFFEDGTEPNHVESVIHEVVYDRYEGVNSEDLATQEMGGTTHLVFFRARGERDQKSVLDPKITQDEVDARIKALFHLLNEF
ncbi:MAG: hypothetical protein US51_C0014G0004 [Microgenomates group bacterium GW2011_GWA2_37_6]|nr:MAG: hypothetical protein US51_C0014G0004 [Microgenomates group bacterium GW2011_GWA2_37_6]